MSESHSPQEAVGPLQLSNSNETPPDMGTSRSRGSISNNRGSTGIGPIQLCNSPTKDTETYDTESAWASGETTPVEENSKVDSKPAPDALPQDRNNEPDHPPLVRSGSSVMQVRRPEQGNWYSDARKGYQRTTKYFYQEIDTSWTVVMLIACYFVSGLIDAVAFGVWGVFVAMQTGNTIFLASRISNPSRTHHPLNYLKSLVSIGGYCVGALCFNCLHRAPTGLSNPATMKRWTLTTSFLMQASLLLTAALLAQMNVISVGDKECGTFSSGTPLSPGDNYIDLLGIAILAIETAGQVCLSRVLLVNELPTIVLSTLYHDLVADSLGVRKCWMESSSIWDFMVSQKRQARRLACILALFSGALIGGFVFQSPAGLAAALWLAFAIKTTIAVTWCLWRRKTVTETVTENSKT